eukprot:11385914-Alexandrium_andersonii.AAC.1
MRSPCDCGPGIAIVQPLSDAGSALLTAGGAFDPLDLGVRELRHDTTHGRTAMLASLQLRGPLRVAPALQRRFPWTAHALGDIFAEAWVHAIAYSAYVGLLTDQTDSRLGSMT